MGASRRYNHIPVVIENLFNDRSVLSHVSTPCKSGPIEFEPSLVEHTPGMLNQLFLVLIRQYSTEANGIP
jgi:hypothetical protein